MRQLRKPSFPAGARGALWNRGRGYCVLTSIVTFMIVDSRADDSPQPQSGVVNLKQLSLEQLGDVEVTSVSKDPQQLMKTPSAIFVITQEDIRRSGATSIPEALRLAPGVEVARIDADHWSVAIRGLAGQFSKDLLVLIDGRSVATAGTHAVAIKDVPGNDAQRIRSRVIHGSGKQD